MAKKSAEPKEIPASLASDGECIVSEDDVKKLFAVAQQTWERSYMTLIHGWTAPDGRFYLKSAVFDFIEFLSYKPKGMGLHEYKSRRAAQWLRSWEAGGAEQ